MKGALCGFMLAHSLLGVGATRGVSRFALFGREGAG